MRRRGEDIHPSLEIGTFIQQVPWSSNFSLEVTLEVTFVALRIKKTSKNKRVVSCVQVLMEDTESKVTLQ